MYVKDLFGWFHDKIHNYNLFIPDEDENEDENNLEENHDIILKNQIYATRVYVPLLTIILYILFFISLMNSQARLYSISNITPDLFTKLHYEYGQSLSCPCTTTNIPYNKFTSTIITYKPICSSIFVSEQWIKALYMPNSSTYLVMDFRTTASSQFEILSALCSIAQNIVYQSLVDFNEIQLVTLELLQENQIESQIDDNIKVINSKTLVQFVSPLNFLQIITQSNSFISALNTNVAVKIQINNGLPQINVNPSMYVDKNASTPWAAVWGSPCSFKHATVPSGFYSLSEYESVMNHRYWPYYPPYFEPIASSTVDGFFGGCTPLDAILSSTLDCLYNISCLEIFINYFPGLNQTDFNMSNIVLSSNEKIISLKDSLNNSFIENWSTKMNYSDYFSQCAPTVCTYTKKDYTNLSHIITLLLSLYGGLTIILRVMIGFSIKIYSKIKHRSLNTNNNNNNKYLLTYIWIFIRWIKHLNLFKSQKNQIINTAERQRIITRIYLVFLTNSIVILILFTWMNNETVTVNVPNPSLATYKHLQNLYPNVLKCPCLNVTTPYNKFMSVSPTFHQICSSEFVSETWITALFSLDSIESFALQYGEISTFPLWYGLDGRHFRLLSTLCQLANETIIDAIHSFDIQFLIGLNVLTELDFNAQTETTFNQFIQSLISNFDLLVNMTHLFTQVDQPYTTFDNSNLTVSSTIDNITNQQSLRVTFNLTGIQDTNSTSGNCICASNPNCQSSVIPPDWIQSNYEYSEHYPSNHIIPGMIQGCFTIDTLLLSSLECYYLHSCLSILYNLLSGLFHDYEYDLEWSPINPLIYNSSSSHFFPNTSLSLIINEMLIEQWNPLSSFEHYYESCAPIYCSYTYTTHTITFIAMIIKLVSTIGGLILILRLITPQLVKFVYKILTRHTRRQDQEINSNLFNRIKIFLCNTMRFLSVTLINLNIFPKRSFANNINHMKAQHLGRLSTRLYIVLLIIVIAILSLYTIIQPQILTKSFSQPSFKTYNDLLTHHSSTIQCPCSSISSTYNQFINIEPIFHQICSSSFISDEWRTYITKDLVSDLSIYNIQDYRRFITPHLQFLSGLCGLSIQSVNDSINQFLSSTLVTVELLSETSFRTQIDLLIKQSKSNAPITFTRLLSLIRTINHGNAIISSYGTNFEFIDPWKDLNLSMAITHAITYDNECSCALISNCTTQANFINENSLEMLPIKGLKIGCTPSESFLSSTLECFYDLSCIHFLEEQMNTTHTNNSMINLSSPLSLNLSQYPMNISILNLVQDLFIENWLTNISYSLYYNQCSPASCLYTYIQQLNSLYTMSILLGLYAGLSFILKMICPNIISIIDKIYWYKKKKKNIIEPACTVEMTNIKPITTRLTNIEPITTGLTNIDIYNTIDNPKSLSATTTTKILSKLMLCFIFGIILLVFMIISIIITFIFLNRQQETYNIPTISSINTAIIPTTDINILTTTVSPPTESICQLTFQHIILYNNSDGFEPPSFIINDFNGDNHSDIAVTNCVYNIVNIWSGNGNGSFDFKTTFSTGGLCPFAIDVGDFNRDGLLDFVVINAHSNNIVILFANTNGTYQVRQTLTRRRLIPLSVVIGDYDNDGYLDLAATNFDNILIFFSDNNGTFGTPLTFCADICQQLLSIAVGDFNNDGRLDLAVTDHSGPYGNNTLIEYAYILLNNGSGYFNTLMSYAVGKLSLPNSIAVHDFNNDNQMDLVIANTWASNVVILLGSTNGTFFTQMPHSTGSVSEPDSVIAGDLNNDGLQDFAVTNTYTNNIGIFFGIGNGSFRTQTSVFTGASSAPYALASGDFNGDGKLDLVISDIALNTISILLNTCHCCSP
ncbi:unnamed protein product [Adineta steineri]|uniref:Uncharacterized protein n=1 Tax=Adineta steineri TaxID=433720 RepID=A0A814VKU6_9BILA|nr:unnamed protein product [Adineta steineri]CAF1190359.1 unnamed protein product [Adineta steineri]